MEEADDGGVAHRVPEEEVLDSGGANHPQQGDGQEEAPEAGGLAGIAVPDVVAQDALGLVLQHLHGVHIRQTRGLCNARKGREFQFQSP